MAVSGYRMSSRCAIGTAVLVALALLVQPARVAVAQTPTTTPAASCPACADYTKQIAYIDRQIGSLQRSNASLEQGNVNDPGVQNALKEDEAKIARLQAQRNDLAAKKSECERKCPQPARAPAPPAPTQPAVSPTPTPPVPPQTGPAQPTP